MTKKNKWTEEEMEVLRTMYHAGEKHKDIARILNRSEGAVQQRASMMGMQSPSLRSASPIVYGNDGGSSAGGVRSSLHGLNLSSSLSALSPHAANKTYWHSKPRQVEPIRWQRGEVIGQGAYGTVYLGLNLDTGELMAIKQLDAKEVSEKELAVLENELKLLIGQALPSPAQDGDGGGRAGSGRP